MFLSLDEVETDEDSMRHYEQIKSKLGSIAAKPEIAKLMAEFGMAKDPFPETDSMAEDPIKMPNTLYEHFGFLLRSGVAPEKITLRVLSRPKWFRRSLELRRDDASQKVIFWTLTDQGRLLKEYVAPTLHGKATYLILNAIVDLFKESALSNKIWSGITALLLVLLWANRSQKLWHGEHLLLNALLVIIGFFGASGFAYNLYPERMFDEKAQTTIASAFLFFFALWLLTASGYGIFAAVRMVAHH
ncbi:MAG TPA: hypothetical protein VN943_17735 [Candidatus Acidoferrum sp.]|nr:hypothetical protein [Candidatus Acidoferrum sp.]